MLECVKQVFVKDDFKLSFYDGLKMYDLAGLRSSCLDNRRLHSGSSGEIFDAFKYRNGNNE